jgi:regulator of telomere elongation helicase 1
VDPRIRKSLAINLEESVVIIDEAHNILRMFEDSSSVSFTAKEIALALSELDFLLDFRSKADEDGTGVYEETLADLPNFDTSQVYALKDCLSKFEKGMMDFSKGIAPNSSTDYTGEQVLKIFEECGVTGNNAPLLTGAITNALDVISHLNIASAGNKGKGLTSMKELVDMLYLDGSGVNAQEKMTLYYRFHVSQVESKFGGGKDTQFNLWCFHPGFSLASLVKCKIRTMVLTSGTLKPMDSFQAELSAEFSVKLQNDHVINAKKQINYQVISRGPDGQELLATFANRSNLKYLTSLGQSLVEIAKVVPDGLLVFFPSYAWMDSCLAQWKQMGVWERLNHWKECFVEPKNRSALSKTVSEFRAKVRHVSRIGACFLAVCRGKVSEGIDFADADARAVVITGIPYPSVFDPKVSLKKKFLDSQKKNGSKTLSGNEWYNLEAFKAINQAVGRVIRHKSDFGAVLLLDKRFALPASTSKLSSWLPPIAKFDQFKSSVQSLEAFFSEHQYFPKPATTKAVKNAIVGKKPMSITSMVAAASTSSSSNSIGPPSKRQKIVIKPRAPLVIKQPATAEAQAEVSDVKVAKTTSQEATGSSIKDIQHFVLKLKERLEKSAIKEIILCVRSYKEKGDVRPLAEKLNSFSSKLRPEDFDEFRSFVRGTDDKRIFDDVCVRRRL